MLRKSLSGAGLNDREHVPRYGEEMTDASGEYEQVPDRMIERHPVSHIEHCAHRIADAARHNPVHTAGTYGGSDLWCGNDHEPTHHQIANQLQPGVAMPQPELG